MFYGGAVQELPSGLLGLSKPVIHLKLTLPELLLLFMELPVKSQLALCQVVSLLNFLLSLRLVSECICRSCPPHSVLHSTQLDVSCLRSLILSKTLHEGVSVLK